MVGLIFDTMMIKAGWWFTEASLVVQLHHLQVIGRLHAQ